VDNLFLNSPLSKRFLLIQEIVIRKTVDLVQMTALYVPTSSTLGAAEAEPLPVRTGQPFHITL
jgi:hypothetical protein